MELNPLLPNLPSENQNKNKKIEFHFAEYQETLLAVF